MAADSAWSIGEATNQWFERVWNQQDEAMITELMAEDCDLHGLDLPIGGREGFLAFHRALSGAFANLNVEILELIESGDHVMGHCLFTGTHRATGKDVSTHFSFSGKWKDGLLIETRNVVDFTRMLAQIGELAPDTMARVFTPPVDS